MNNKKIGWLGLGKMGKPMAAQFIKAGYEVTIYNRSKDKEAALKEMGAGIAVTPKELLERTDAVFIMVTDDAAIHDIFRGADGLLQANASGRLVINMSTVSAAVSIEMAALCSQQGNHYIDAPVSGSVKQAEDGSLVVMAGCEDAVFEDAKELLQHLSKLVLHVGQTGAGNNAKLAINVLLSFHAQGLAEAILFAQQNGVKTEDFLAVFNNSALGNVFGKIKGDAILSNNYNAAFALKHIAKDLRLAHDKGLDTPLARTAYETFQKAEQAHGEEDIIAVIKTL